MDATDGVAPVVIPEDTSEVGAHVEQMEETFTSIMNALVDQNCESQALVRGMTYLIGFGIFAVLMFFAIVFWFADVCAKGQKYNNLSEITTHHKRHQLFAF